MGYEEELVEVWICGTSRQCSLSLSICQKSRRSHNQRPQCHTCNRQACRMALALFRDGLLVHQERHIGLFSLSLSSLSTAPKFYQFHQFFVLGRLWAILSSVPPRTRLGFQDGSSCQKMKCNIYHISKYREIPLPFVRFVTLSPPFEIA